MDDRHDCLLSKPASGLRVPRVERSASIIRDHVVPLVQSRGQGHQYGCMGACGPLHLTTWDCSPFRFVLRVPFRPPGVSGKTAIQRPEVLAELSHPALRRGCLATAEGAQCGMGPRRADRGGWLSARRVGDRDAVALAHRPAASAPRARSLFVPKLPASARIALVRPLGAAYNNGAS